MSSELVEIQPSILKFTFEIRKQTTCLIQLINKSEHFVGFKVKTTSPKKYVVKPNTGVIKPRGTSDFTVIMLAQIEAPPELLCKDKFLIQSTIVPFGVSEENITSEMFVKGPNRTIEDKKLKVILVPPTNSTTESPESPPSIGVQHQDHPPAGTEEHSQQKDEKGSQFAKATEEIQLSKGADPRAAEDADELMVRRSVYSDELRSDGSREVQKLDEEKVSTMDARLGREAEDLTLKLNTLGSKLALAEHTAVQLREERNKILHEKELICQDLALARRKNVVKKVYKGYPLLYVFMVSMFSLTFGYLIRQ